METYEKTDSGIKLVKEQPPLEQHFDVGYIAKERKVIADSQEILDNMSAFLDKIEGQFTKLGVEITPVELSVNNKINEI